MEILLILLAALVLAAVFIVVVVIAAVVFTYRLNRTIAKGVRALDDDDPFKRGF